MNLSLFETRLSTAQVETRINLLRRVVAIAAIVLFASTWRLWTPQTVFPQVPLISAFGFLPVWVEWLLATVVAIALPVTLVAPWKARSCWQVAFALFAVSIGLFVLIDQHRLQPWAYQFALIAVVLSMARSITAFNLLRWLAISIYFYSAVSKMDYSFIHSHGQTMVETVLNVFGRSMHRWSDTSRLVAAGSLPAFEMLIAISLCFARTRGVAMVGSFAMHGLLLAFVGPLGLNHENPVLIWNLYFIVQNLILFDDGNRFLSRIIQSRQGNTNSQTCVGHEENTQPPALEMLAVGVIAVAIGTPVFEYFGYFDVWPSWGVYSARPAKVRVLTQSGDHGEFDHLVDRKHIGPVEPLLWAPNGYTGTAWADVRPIDIHSWSIEALGVPVYPEDRFLIAVSLYFGYPNMKFDPGVAVLIWSDADRWTGNRKVTRVTQIEDIKQFADENYILNTRPKMQKRQ